MSPRCDSCERAEAAAGAGAICAELMSRATSDSLLIDSFGGARALLGACALPGAPVDDDASPEDEPTPLQRDDEGPPPSSLLVFVLAGPCACFSLLPAAARCVACRRVLGAPPEEPVGSSFLNDVSGFAGGALLGNAAGAGSNLVAVAVLATTAGCDFAGGGDWGEPGTSSTSMIGGGRSTGPGRAGRLLCES